MRSSRLLRPPPEWSARLALGLGVYGLFVGFAGSFTGLGGGFILVPFLLMLRLPLHQAVGTSFVAVLAISLTALSKHAAYGNIVVEVGVALGVGGLIGSQIGARLVRRVSRRRFHKIFSVVLLALAVYLAVQAISHLTAQEPPAAAQAQAQAPPPADEAPQARAVDAPPPREPSSLPAAAEPPAFNVWLGLGLAGIGLAVGMAAAFAGMGGGFLLVPILLVMGYDVVVAVATAFIAILMIASSALIAHVRQKGVLWRHGLVVAAAGVVGAYLGAAVLRDVSPGLFKAIFAALLGVFGARMAFEGWRPSRRAKAAAADPMLAEPPARDEPWE